MELDDDIKEFLIESNEYMAMLDRDILLLEESPDDAELISSIFRGVHTIKGTCGFFGFDLLGSVTHLAESLLSQVRAKERPLTHEMVSLILETLDAVKILLNNIESTGAEGADFMAHLRAKLEAMASGSGVSATPVLSAFPAAAPGLPAAAPAVPQTPVEIAAAEPCTACAAPVAESAASAAQLPATPTSPALPANAPALQGSLASPAELPTPWAAAAEVHEEQERVTDGQPNAAREAQLADSTIRVDVALLDRLMNLVGELVLARNQLMQETSRLNPAIQQTSQRLNLITSELQEGVMKTRMQPIGLAWNKLPRIVRDLAAKCGKRIQVEMEGAETELDKSIIEAIKDPLTHIVRNSCDHGIETPEVRAGKGKRPEGLLHMRAYHEGGVVNIEISDDGAGIDPQRVKAKAVEKRLIRPEDAAVMSDRDATHLIFLPGFSTAAQVTSVSGRGVGMDVVKTNIEKIGGSVDLLNRAEGGTTIRIKIPLTLAIIPGLIVALGPAGSQEPSRWSKQARFIIPQVNLLELVRVEGAELARRVENVHGTPAFHHRNKLLPLLYLGRVLGRPESCESADSANIIVLQSENRQLGLVVDHISDTQEIVVKPLGRQLKGLSCYVGATIMGDGKPALILDVAGLAKLAGLGSQGRPVTHAAQTVSSDSAQPQMMLLFRAGEFERMAVQLSLVDRLEEVPASSVERSSGQPVLYYRGDILPLVTLPGSSALWNAATGSMAADTLHIIVFTNGKRRVGLMVDQIMDIVHEPVTVRRHTPAHGTLGSALIGGRITDLLDLHALVKSTGDDWLGPLSGKDGLRQKLMLIDQSQAARQILAEFLSMAGYHLVQASSTAAAIAYLKEHADVDGILISTRSTDSEKVELLEHLRSGPDLRALPIVELLDGPPEEQTPSPFSARVTRTHCDELLHILQTFLHTPAMQEAQA